jgi:hypothetical protein
MMMIIIIIIIIINRLLFVLLRSTELYNCTCLSIGLFHLLHVRRE